MLFHSNLLYKPRSLPLSSRPPLLQHLMCSEIPGKNGLPSLCWFEICFTGGHTTYHINRCNIPKKLGILQYYPVIPSKWRKGNYRYMISRPAGYHHVLIWCRLYDVSLLTSRNFWDIAWKPLCHVRHNVFFYRLKVDVHLEILKHLLNNIWHKTVTLIFPQKHGLSTPWNSRSFRWSGIHIHQLLRSYKSKPAAHCPLSFSRMRFKITTTWSVGDQLSDQPWNDNKHVVHHYPALLIQQIFESSSTKEKKTCKSCISCMSF